MVKYLHCINNDGTVTFFKLKRLILKYLTRIYVETILIMTSSSSLITTNQITELEGLLTTQKKFENLKSNEQDILLKLIESQSSTKYKYPLISREIYKFVCSFHTDEKDDFLINGMLLPAMMGMEYESKDDKKNFIKRVLQEQGTEGTDWIFKTKSDIFCVVNVDHSIEIPVPGRPGKYVIVPQNAAHNAKWPFLTPNFMKSLLLSKNYKFPEANGIVEDFRNFLWDVHDLCLRFIQNRVISEPRRYKRNKSARMTHELSQREINRVRNQGRTRVGNPYLGPRVNDKINEFVTGYKRKNLGLILNHADPKKTNVRDHMSTTQLAATELLSSILRDEIDENGGDMDSHSVLGILEDSLEKFKPLRPKLLKQNPATVPKLKNKTIN